MHALKVCFVLYVRARAIKINRSSGCNECLRHPPYPITAVAISADDKNNNCTAPTTTLACQGRSSAYTRMFILKMLRVTDVGVVPMAVNPGLPPTFFK